MMGCRNRARRTTSPSRSLPLFAAVAWVGCASEPGPGSESHFLRCAEDADCPVGVCVETYCEKDGQRISVDQVEALGGPGGEDSGGGRALEGWESGSHAGFAGTDGAAIAGAGGGAIGVSANGGSAKPLAGSAGSGGATPGGADSPTGSSSLDFAGAAGNGTAGTRATPELGACGHPLLRFRIEAVEGVKLCAAPMFMPAPLGFEKKYLWIADTPPLAKSAGLLPAEGLELVWAGQLETQGNVIQCTNSEPSICEYETENACLGERTELQDLWPKDGAGNFTATLEAYPVSPRGTCANDLMQIELSFDLEQGGTYSAKASDFELPDFAASFACGELSCNTATEYCEAHGQTAGVASDYTNPVCQPYPQQCLNDHMCECLEPHLAAVSACLGDYLAGPTTVLWPAE